MANPVCSLRESSPLNSINLYSFSGSSFQAISEKDICASYLQKKSTVTRFIRPNFDIVEVRSAKKEEMTGVLPLL